MRRASGLRYNEGMKTLITIAVAVGLLTLLILNADASTVNFVSIGLVSLATIVTSFGLRDIGRDLYRLMADVRALERGRILHDQAEPYRLSVDPTLDAIRVYPVIEAMDAGATLADAFNATDLTFMGHKSVDTMPDFVVELLSENLARARVLLADYPLALKLAQAAEVRK